MKDRDLAALLRRAIAAIEDPSSLTDTEVAEVVEDLEVEAGLIDPDSKS